MRASAIMAFVGCTIVSISACAIFLTGCSQDKQQEPTVVNNYNYNNSFNSNTTDNSTDNSIDYNYNNEDYDIDIQAEENNTQDTTNENSTINPPVQSVQPTQDKQQKTQQENTIQNQPQQKSTTASSLKNNINNTTSTTEEISNNTSDKGITLRQPEKQEIPAKQPDTCEYCGETGKLHGNLRVWMDTNGTDHTTHNKDCTKAYINETGIQPDSELELD